MHSLNKAESSRAHISYAYISMAFAVALITANIFERRPILLFGATLPGGAIIFPLTYPLLDTITEIFKRDKARKVIWMGAACNMLYLLYGLFILNSPAPSFFAQHDAYDEVFSASWVVIIASLVSFVVRDRVNAEALTRIRIVTNGKYLWFRCILSTLIAHIIGGILFVPAVWGTVASASEMLNLYIDDFIVKIIIAFVGYPFQSYFIHYLKSIGAEEPNDWDKESMKSKSAIEIAFSKDV